MKWRAFFESGNAVRVSALWAGLGVALGAFGAHALKAVWHRGAVDADGKTGDGAGIHVEIPVDFFHEHIERAGHRPRPNLLAVGQIFLPRTDLAAQESCRTIVESEIIGFGYKIYGWRRVPVDVSVIGDKAMQSRPEIEQIMIAGPRTGRIVDRAAAEAVMTMLPFDEPPLYARIDMVRMDSGQLAVIEAELIEPYLYPEQGPGFGKMFADATIDRFASRTSSGSLPA